MYYTNDHGITMLKLTVGYNVVYSQITLSLTDVDIDGVPQQLTAETSSF